MFMVLKRIKSLVPKELAELAQLGRSLSKRCNEIWRTSIPMVRWRLSTLGSSTRVFARYRVGFSSTFILRPLIHSRQFLVSVNAL